MKKQIVAVLILSSTLFLNGGGYKGILPDLEIKQDDIPKQKELPAKNTDILPLDKLTIPVQNITKIDKVEQKYNHDMINCIRQLERMKEVLDGDKSFKNYVAAANVLNLSTQNILQEFREDRFRKTNKILSDITYDSMQIRDYWIKINKNAPYVSYYQTQGAYSGAVLNEQLNNFSNVLGQAIRELKKEFIKE